MPRRLIDSPWPYFTAAAVLLLVAAATQFEFTLPPRPTGSEAELRGLRDRDDTNVVFVVIDTLRADRVGAYGYERDTTPNIDTLARHGVLFRDVVSQSSWTKTSMASLWSGTYPINHGITRFDQVLPPEAVLPAEIFKRAGFRTAGVWRNGWVAPNFGFDQGFDIYLHPSPGEAQRRVQMSRPSGGTLPGSDEDILMAAFEFLDAFGKDRFFLYLHLMDLHQYVYDETAPHYGSSYSDSYDQALHWEDRVIGLLVNHLEKAGLLDRTLIAITSDHGEAFLEHGHEGHARNLYSEVVQVPWIISLPFLLKRGIVVDERVENIDVWPTLLDLLGMPGLLKPDGRSLVPTLVAALGGEVSAGAPTRRRAISHLDRYWGQSQRSKPLVAVIEGPHRLMHWADGPDSDELYDTRTDPGEKKNLYDPADPDGERLTSTAREYLEGGESPWGAPPIQVELDELRLNQLRALGYDVGR